MRILFGVLGLLIVASIVLSVARKQLQAVNSLPQLPAVTSSESEPVAPARGGERGSRIDAFPGAAAADPNTLTVPQQSQNLQNKVANDVNRIMQNAPARAEPQ